MTAPKRDDDRPLADRRQPGSEDVFDEPDFAEENTPSPTDPPNAEADDDAPDERWEKPTDV